MLERLQDRLLLLAGQGHDPGPQEKRVIELAPERPTEDRGQPPHEPIVNGHPTQDHAVRLPSMFVGQSYCRTAPTGSGQGELLAGARRFAFPQEGNDGCMAKGDVHVVPSKDGWRVEVAADGRARSVHRTQAEAREAAREIARRNRRELFVHGRDGQIRERNTYGKDPRRSKG
jgi:hypothetical protein